MTAVSTPLTADLRITRLTGTIGAEIAGVDTAGPIGDDVVARIRATLLAHKVVFLREQGHDYATQAAFAARLGRLAPSHPIYDAPEGRPALRELDSSHGTRANHWHTDLTFVEAPPAFAFLHMKTVPPVGGDTMWANCATGYQSMSVELRDLADRLRVVHSNDSDYTDATVANRRDYIADLFEAEQPAVRVHAETGERSLLLGGFARSVNGLGPAGSRDLLRVLQDHVTRPEHTVRWRWSPGDLAIWDNQSTLHYAVADYGDAHRRAERVATVGPVPVGVDGRPGRALSGDTSDFAAGL